MSLLSIKSKKIAPGATTSSSRYLIRLKFSFGNVKRNGERELLFSLFITENPNTEKLLVYKFSILDSSFLRCNIPFSVSFFSGKFWIFLEASSYYGILI